MTAPIVSAHDLAVGWGRDSILLEHATFEIMPSEIFGILGRSACGKSTLMRALIGLETPLAGDVAIAGHPGPGGQPGFGVMFQQGALFGSMTLAENVAFALERWTSLPADAIAAIVRAKLRLVGLEDARHVLPTALSGGMRKRAAIARAIALEPALVFLDEPSSGLDPITSAEIDRLIVTLARDLGLTVVIVTHELASISAIVDRCIVLDRESRSIIAAGRPSELAASTIPRVRHFFAREAEAA